MSDMEIIHDEYGIHFIMAEDSPIYEIFLTPPENRRSDTKPTTLKLYFQAIEKDRNGKQVEYKSAALLRDILPIESMNMIDSNYVQFSTHYLESIHDTLNFLRDRQLLIAEPDDLLTICAHARARSGGRLVYAYQYQSHVAEALPPVPQEGVGHLVHFMRHQFLSALYPTYKGDVRKLLAAESRSLSMQQPEEVHSYITPLSIEQHTKLTQILSRMSQLDQKDKGTGRG